MGEDGTVLLMLMPTQMLLLLILSLLLLINMLCLGHWVQPYLATKGTIVLVTSFWGLWKVLCGENYWGWGVGDGDNFLWIVWGVLGINFA